MKVWSRIRISELIWPALLRPPPLLSPYTIAVCFFSQWCMKNDGIHFLLVLEAPVYCGHDSRIKKYTTSWEAALAAAAANKTKNILLQKRFGMLLPQPTTYEAFGGGHTECWLRCQHVQALTGLVDLTISPSSTMNPNGIIFQYFWTCKFSAPYLIYFCTFRNVLL